MTPEIIKINTICIVVLNTTNSDLLLYPSPIFKTARIVCSHLNFGKTTFRTEFYRCVIDNNTVKQINKNQLNKAIRE